MIELQVPTVDAGYRAALSCRLPGSYQRATAATAHKLLRTIYPVLRNRRLCRDPEFDCETLMVHRNAAHWVRKLDEYGCWPKLDSAPKPQAA